VQIIEFVTGNPSTEKITCAADGTFSSAGAGEFAGFEIVPAIELLAACEDGCAPKFAAQMAMKNAQAKKILLNCFTVKKSLQTTPIAQLTKPIVGLRI
jgi:hypothetical protein